MKKKFGFSKKETILVGDTEIDSLLAKNFKIKFILFKKGYTSLDPKNIKYDIAISNYSKLKICIRNFTKLI